MNLVLTLNTKYCGTLLEPLTVSFKFIQTITNIFIIYEIINFITTCRLASMKHSQAFEEVQHTSNIIISRINCLPYVKFLLIII